MRFGVISDTHGFLDPRVLKIFEGVDHIFHGGDIGFASIILELEQVAPVTAVLGNTDAGLDFKETEIVSVGEWKVFLHHILLPTLSVEAALKRLQRERPHLVVFGHSHRPYAAAHGGAFFLNPGYAGRPRFNSPRSVALVTAGPEGLSHQFVPLD
jgi:uncharacterized protein